MASIRSVRQRELRARLDALPTPEQPTRRYRLAPEPPERAQVSLTIPIADRRLATAAAEPPPPVEAPRTDTPLRMASLAPTVPTRLPKPAPAEPAAGENAASAHRNPRSPKPRWVAVVLVVLTAAVVLLLKAHVWQS
jgi:hypothetical protein